MYFIKHPTSLEIYLPYDCLETAARGFIALKRSISPVGSVRSTALALLMSLLTDGSNCWPEAVKLRLTNSSVR